MHRPGSKTYLELRNYLDSVPIIDSHEHYAGSVKPLGDVLLHPVLGYLGTDLLSASFGFEREAYEKLNNTKLNMDERYDTFEWLYAKTKNTGYARGIRLGLEACWGIKGLGRKTFAELEGRAEDERAQAFADRLMEQHGIKAMISDVFWGVKKVIEGEDTNYSPLARFALSLPNLHKLSTMATSFCCKIICRIRSHSLMII